jgi:asparagine synthase (glutamine-hydrolysing)
MSIIDENIPLYQMFTEPDVFGFIWSLSPKCRTDGIYELMLRKLSSNMLDIPWARDGKIYNKANSSALDNLNKSYHRYGDWLRNDNREFVVEQITNGNLASLNIFNEKALKFWCKNWRGDNRARADRLDEKMAWLASLSIFVGKYDIKGLAVETENSILDSAQLLKARLHESLYYTATKLKK